MLNVIADTNFPIDRTGIYSTGNSILAHWPRHAWRLYSNQSTCFAGQWPRPLTELPADSGQATLIFTHLEYKGLAQLLKTYPRALVHVGDWPGCYWRSVAQNQSWLRGSVGALAFWAKIAKLPKTARLVFVSEADTAAALQSGFKFAQTLHLGVTPPSIPLAEAIDPLTVCFTGSFRYAPNIDAAHALIQWGKQHPDFHIHLAGFYVNELSTSGSEHLSLHEDVSSMPNFLATRRPVYVSLIKTGAGAKNKILEALTAGCPIIATPESLDGSTSGISLIHQIRSAAEIGPQLARIKREASMYSAATAELARSVTENRSWRSIAEQLEAMLADTPFSPKPGAVA
jgi:glycosyltransferase involved in cell wall biosynthesis